MNKEKQKLERVRKIRKGENVNINEIAKRAGVSRATVSRYLNDGYVSAEKSEMIRKVIEETGYEPSYQAQNLRKQVTKIIGVIIPRIQSEAVSRMVAGISEVLAKENYQLLLANTQNNEEEELKYLKTFRKNRVDGIIFMGTIFSKAHHKLLKEIEVPIVILGQQIDGFACVYHDDFHAAKEAATLLMEKGKKIAYIGATSKDKAVGEQRRKGFLEAASEKGFEVPEELILECDFDMKEAYKSGKKLLEKEPAIDSILCATDRIALGVKKYLDEVGKAVPGEVQLMGFGDSSICQIVTPTMSTVHFYYESCGKEAARILLDIINSDEDQKRVMKMGYRIERNGSIR